VRPLAEYLEIVRNRKSPSANGEAPIWRLFPSK
jgi:hypothetical protein